VLDWRLGQVPRLLFRHGRKAAPRKFPLQAAGWQNLQTRLRARALLVRGSSTAFLILSPLLAGQGIHLVGSGKTLSPTLRHPDQNCLAFQVDTSDSCDGRKSAAEQDNDYDDLYY
jgi:hypothetical protein